MRLHILPAGPIQTNAYLLLADSLHQAVLIDAPDGVWTPVQRLLVDAGCQLTALWLTHGHWDHIQGVTAVVEATGVPVSGHRGDQVLFENSREVLMRETPHLAPPGVEAMEPIAISHWWEDGEKQSALGLDFEVRHVPGHSPGSVLFYFPALGTVFAGDALFKRSVGRSDLPGGDFFQLSKSIRQKIYSLPEATTVYPGHGPATTVGEERQSNPFVRAA